MYSGGTENDAGADNTGQKPAEGLVDAMSLVGGAGVAGWWSWTISPDGVSWSFSNCATIVTPTT